MKNDLETRRDSYFRLNTHLAHLDNEQVKSLFEEDVDKTDGWGINHIFKMGQTTIFVKRMPLTDLEYNHLFSTKNLYNLPTYYNYGVGSAGFGAFRELVAHIKTTNWVLAGEIETFPLMYHYRIIPRFGEKPAIDIDRHKRYVAYWNSNENIGKFMLDRKNAQHELVLFLEYIPHVLVSWLPNNLDQLDWVVAEMRDTITFLRKKGIIHFDVHFHNVLTDGKRPYLTDFGLVLDRRFGLSEQERLFFKQNAFYDYGEFLLNLSWPLITIFNRLPQTKKKKVLQRYGVNDDWNAQKHTALLLDNISDLATDGVLNLDKNYVDVLLQYRDVILMMQTFFTDMQQNEQKDTKYSHTKLKRLLKETNFLP